MYKSLFVLHDKVFNHNLEKIVDNNWLPYIHTDIGIYYEDFNVDAYDEFIIACMREQLEGGQLIDELNKRKFIEENDLYDLMECYYAKDFDNGIKLLVKILDVVVYQLKNKLDKENKLTIFDFISILRAYAYNHLDFLSFDWLYKFYENEDKFSKKKILRNKKVKNEVTFFKLFNMIYFFNHNLENYENFYFYQVNRALGNY